ncbi:HEAT repeat domain-containing protein [Microbispora triticiradicis]|uniref:HEAT repeat domain-containing protein n=2 Tax=Microbispora TaxID=2005 RepID=A0ABY3M5V6_9ACTN|nr:MULTISPECIES: HEAT repeat domain-containing protein [Microbispora]TLP66279.1 hypothetical protein FED44_01875 [Microbispora fusca]TYB68063.1 hypothetical protein FXF59_00615 [Microbispora tritici]
MGVSERPPAAGDRDDGARGPEDAKDTADAKDTPYEAAGRGDDGGEPAHELIRIALTDTDPDGPVRWRAITTLQARGDPETFALARRLCVSADPAERVLGADILGELGRDHPLRDRTLPVLRALAADEDDPRVLYSVLIAFGHLRDGRALPSVIDLAAHEHPTVRYGAAYALPHVMGDPPDTAGLAALRRLAADADEDVADWAALGLSLNGLAPNAAPAKRSSASRGQVDDLGGQVLDP